MRRCRRGVTGPKGWEGEENRYMCMWRERETESERERKGENTWISRDCLRIAAWQELWYLDGHRLLTLTWQGVDIWKTYNLILLFSFHLFFCCFHWPSTHGNHFDITLWFSMLERGRSNFVPRGHFWLFQLWKEGRRC